MFYSNKYTRWYYSIIHEAQSQERKKLPKNYTNYVYYERHHIIPKSLGGKDTVLLTAKEHFICHILLPKMCMNEKHKQQMLNALHKMKSKNPHQKERYFSSVLYEYAKKHIIYPEERKEKQKKLVSCLNILTMRYEQVSKEIFDNSIHLVGVNYGKRGRKMSEEFKENRRGSKNPFYKKKHKKETLEKISISISKAHKNRPKSEKHKQSLSNSHKGKPKKRKKIKI
jgi:hypothetical protein